MSDERFKLPMARNEITLQVIGEEVMLHDSESDTIHVLNHTAYAVWQLCNGENTREDMLKKISDQFPDAGSGLFDDIQQTLESFAEKELLVK